MQKYGLFAVAIGTVLLQGYARPSFHDRRQYGVCNGQCTDISKIQESCGTTGIGGNPTKCLCTKEYIAASANCYDCLYTNSPESYPGSTLQGILDGVVTFCKTLGVTLPDPKIGAQTSSTTLASSMAVKSTTSQQPTSTTITPAVISSPPQIPTTTQVFSTTSTTSIASSNSNTPSLNGTITIVKNDDPRIVYSPSLAWNRTSDVPGCTDSGSVQESSTADATISFTFFGSGMAVNHLNSPSGAAYSIFIDGSAPIPFDSFSPSSGAVCAVPFSDNTLALSTQHTVIIQVKGSSAAANATLGGGTTHFDFDSFVVVAMPSMSAAGKISPALLAFVIPFVGIFLLFLDL